MEIIRASVKNLNILANLFDEYRQFYQQESDIESAKMFLTSRLENNQSIIFLALDNNKGAGFTQLYPSFSSVSMEKIFILNDLYVNPDYRKSGIGTLLLEKAKNYSFENNSIRLFLETDKTNHSAQKLYEQNGWTKDNEHFYFTISTKS